MNLPPGWQSIGGLPCYADGDACVVAYANGGGIAYLLVKGAFTDSIIQCGPSFSPAHFAAAEKLLRDHQQKEAERDIEEVFRSEHVTVFRRKPDGAEGVIRAHVCCEGLWSWQVSKPEQYSNGATRHEAEAAAKKALMEKGA